MVDDRHIESFDDDLSGKENSGLFNELREQALVWLVNTSPESIEATKVGLSRPGRLDVIGRALEVALDELAIAEGVAVKPRCWRATKKGGRGHNFDFELQHTDSPEIGKVQVELKRGKSIYDQPQFWQIYTNYPGLLQEDVPTYAEFFFDKFLGELAGRCGTSTGSRSAYLSCVYRTSVDSEPFGTLRRIALQGGEDAKILKDFHYRSIHEYISFLLELPNAGLEFSTFQERLYLQLPKRFLSWDPRGEMFHWERLERESLTLTGSVEAHGKRSGQLHTLVLGTVTGQQLHLLLRWKNRSCVLGPAWQIKLTP